MRVGAWSLSGAGCPDLSTVSQYEHIAAGLRPNVLHPVSWTRVNTVTPPVQPRIGSGLSRRPIRQPLDEPLGVVPPDELPDESSGLKRLKAMQVEALLLQRLEEALSMYNIS